MVPFEPYTIEGDIHNLNYNDGEFDLVFTNIIDHSLYPEKFCSEMERAVKSEGIIVIHLQLGSDLDRYTETQYSYNSHGHLVIRLFNKDDKDAMQKKNGVKIKHEDYLIVFTKDQTDKLEKFVQNHIGRK